MVRLSIASALLFTASATALTPNVAGARSVGNGNGEQFTTGGCIDDSDCAEGCCAGGATDASGNEVGICSGNGAEFQNGKTAAALWTRTRMPPLPRRRRRLRNKGSDGNPIRGGTS